MTTDRYEPYLPVVPGNPVPRSVSAWEWRDSRVHLEHVGDRDAAVRLLLVHGAGGNSAAMWPYAAHLSQLGAYVSVPDLPGYGQTHSPHPGQVQYSDWQKMLVDLVNEEADHRPLVIMGASMGGMLAFDTAAATRLVSGLVVTCLLDPRDPKVRERLTWHPALARLAGPALALANGPLANLRLPLRWIADMRHIANDDGLVTEVLADRTGGGGRAPLGWMRSFLESTPRLEPEQFTDTPVLMVHPGKDRWTPLSVSQPFFDRIASRKRLVALENCGHFPIEQPGFTHMLEAIAQFLDEVHNHRAP